MHPVPHRAGHAARDDAGQRSPSCWPSSAFIALAVDSGAQQDAALDVARRRPALRLRRRDRRARRLLHVSASCRSARSLSAARSRASCALVRARSTPHPPRATRCCVARPDRCAGARCLASRQAGRRILRVQPPGLSQRARARPHVARPAGARRHRALRTRPAVLHRPLRLGGRPTALDAVRRRERDPQGRALLHRGRGPALRAQPRALRVAAALSGDARQPAAWPVYATRPRPALAGCGSVLARLPPRRARRAQGAPSSTRTALCEYD